MFNVMEIQSLSVNVRFSLIADLQLSYFVRFVPEADVILASSIQPVELARIKKLFQESHI